MVIKLDLFKEPQGRFFIFPNGKASTSLGAY